MTERDAWFDIPPPPNPRLAKNTIGHRHRTGNRDSMSIFDEIRKPKRKEKGYDPEGHGPIMEVTL